MKLITIAILINLWIAASAKSSDTIWTLWYKCYVNGEVNEDGWDKEVAPTMEQAIEKFLESKSGWGDCEVWKVEQAKE